MRSCSLILAAFIAVLAVPGPCAADDTIIWQIGKPDNTYAEFAGAGHYESYSQQFSGGAVFRVGSSDPAKDWPFVQPGPVDAWPGPGEHPFEVHFDLDAEPSGVYLLTVDLVDVHASSPPALKARVNEKSRFFDLRHGVSDASLTNPANGREQTVRMYVGAGFLKKGRNIVNLDVTRGSWLLYDCITFVQCDKAPEPLDAPSMASGYWLRERRGVLKQIVTASVDVNSDVPEVRVVLTSEKGWKAEQVFTNVASGRQTFDLEITPVQEQQDVEVRLSCGDNSCQTHGTVYPRKPWRVYLLTSAHFDIGYTGIQDKAIETHRENLERAIDWCGKYPGFIWDLESAFVAEDYLQKGKRPREFMKLSKSGKIGVMGFYANELTGICSGEGLVRLMDYYDYLRHTYGIASLTAMQNDVPSMVPTVPMVLAGHGIKYLSHGVNATRARSDQALYNTPHYWESPDGSRVLTWRTPGYGQSGFVGGVGESGDLQAVSDHLTALLDQYAKRKDYPFDAILLHSAYGDNVPSNDGIARGHALWNKRYDYPKLILCQGPEFFQYIEANFAEDIPTLKGDGGVWWEDGAGSSAYESAITRVAKEQLVTAEKLASLCSPGFQKRMQAQFDEAWKNVLLYDEHTWGAAQSIDQPNSQATLEQWAVKKSFADKAAARTKSILNGCIAEFAAPGARDEADAVLVFNPSSWPRSEVVEYRDSARKKRTLLAQDVPPMGYRLFAPAAAQVRDEVPAESDTLENRYYTVRFDRNTGAVTSIFDKELSRELVDPSVCGLNSYLYVTGGESRILNVDLGKPIPEVKKEFCSGATLVKSASAAGQTMAVTCTAPMARLFRSEVILHDHEKRIDFVNEIDRIPNLAKEGGYFAFPFAFRDPRIRLEVPNGVVRPEVDQYQGACRDWYAVQHFLTVADDSAAVCWTASDSPLITLQDVNRGQWYDHIKIENGNVFAYVFNNYWFTNYKASQEGPHTFRFSLTSARTIDDANAKRFGESVQNPMIGKPVSSKPFAADAASRSYVQVSESSVVVQAARPARFAEGTVIRLREMGGSSVDARLTIRGIPFRKAYLCNLAEDKVRALRVKDGAMQVPCRALGLATVLLER